MLNISEFDDLLGHPVVGTNWQGFLIENIILTLPSTWRYSYYRTTNHTEIDLVLEGPHKNCWAVEIKNLPPLL